MAWFETEQRHLPLAQGLRQAIGRQLFSSCWNVIQQSGVAVDVHAAITLFPRFRPIDANLKCDVSTANPATEKDRFRVSERSPTSTEGFGFNEM
jgi:hypothetical protein